MEHSCLKPLGCLHTANTSLVPGTDLWSLNLSFWPPPEYLRLWWSLQLSFCFSLLNSSVALFSKAFMFPLCFSWSPCQLGGLPECRFLFSFAAYSQEYWSHPDFFFLFLFFSFCSSQLCGKLLTIYVLLPAFTIMFSANHSKWRFFFVCVCAGRWALCLTPPPSLSPAYSHC